MGKLAEARAGGIREAQGESPWERRRKKVKPPQRVRRFKTPSKGGGGRGKNRITHPHIVRGPLSGLPQAPNEKSGSKKGKQDSELHYALTREGRNACTTSQAKKETVNGQGKRKQTRLATGQNSPGWSWGAWLNNGKVSFLSKAKKVKRDEKWKVVKYGCGGTRSESARRASRLSIK